MHKLLPFLLLHLPFPTIASLLPLRIQPAKSLDVLPSRPTPVVYTVASTDVAVASVNDQDGTAVEHSQVPSPIPTPAFFHVAGTTGPHETDGKVNNSAIAVTTILNEDGVSEDYYIEYKGNGTTAGGWPSKTSWVSFADMFNSSKYLFERSCKQYHQEPNSEDETADVYDAIQSVAEETLVDHRFILAIMMQETGGCVRAPTSNYGVPNPGMMQDHNGTATCNDGDGDRVQTPCPSRMIKRMVHDGAAGTDWGDGLAQCINNARANDVSAYYRAARIYNSGSIDKSEDLEEGTATHCYASDVANRLTGWVTYEHNCELDD